MGSNRALDGLFRLTLAATSAFALSAGALGCGNYTPPDVANYGPPNGLNQKNPAAPPSEDAGSSSTTTPPANEDGGGGSGGTSTGEGGTTPTATYACVSAGGTLLTPGTCSVSWKTDIYPKMESGGAWNCASASCHGAGSVTQPVLAGTTEQSFYTALANYTGTTSAGLPYFNPCSTDPTKSEFACNTASSNACGAAAMPLGAPIADTSAISTWVACGAPEN